MTNILIKYLEERHKPDIDPTDEIQPTGPVITISRNFGCPAKTVAARLQDILSKRSVDTGEKEWRVITKEILDEAAKELGMEPEKIEYVFKFEKKSVIDDIIEAFTHKYYKSDRRIKKTVKEVIYSFGAEGNAIIVGRCGATITRGIPKSLHIRLIAPIKHRLPWIKETFGLSTRDAERMARETDKNRALLRNEFAEKRVDDLDFDLIFNTKSMTVDEITNVIINIMELKGFI